MRSHKVVSPEAGPVGVSKVSEGGFRAVVDTGLVTRGEAGLEMTVWGSAEPLEWEVRDWSSKQWSSQSPRDPHGYGKTAARRDGSRGCWTF